MFKNRSLEKEILDTHSLAEANIQKNLKEFSFLNYWLGTRHALIKAVKNVFWQYPLETSLEVTLADLGCGGGDLLSTLHHWAGKNNKKLKLIGFDVHPTIVSFARKNTASVSQIQIQSLNVLSEDIENYSFDIVCLNNICHHFTDNELIALLQRLKKITGLAIVITDLRRHPIPYYFIKIFTKLFRYSFLAQYDGPLSVLKAFKKDELLGCLKQANLRRYSLKSSFGFRWKLIIWCKD